MIDLESKAEHNVYMLVVAHPDDAEFPAGGTIARLTALGKRVIIIQVTSGDKGSPDPTTIPAELARRREAEETEAARRMGVTEVVFLRQPDGELEPTIALREKIVRMVRTYLPDVVLTHDPFRAYAFHPDHRAVGYATTDSVYPTARDPLYFSHHLTDEGLTTHKTAEIWYFGAEHPDLIVDITDTFATKMHALKAHVSQVGDGVAMEERMAERARELAKGTAYEMAEAFKVVQMRR